MNNNVLFLADTAHHTHAVQDHIRAITHFSNYRWFVENPLTCKILDRVDLNQFSAIGIHYSIKAHSDYYLSAVLREKIKSYTGCKFIFIQDEYRHVNLTQQTIVDLGISILFTLLTPDYYQKGYPHPALQSVRKITVLTGYVPDQLLHLNPEPITHRPIDIFYRSREYPYWLGQLAYERVEIATGVLSRANHYALQVDISINEADRIYGEAWINTLQQSKTVLGTESGASIWDFSGEVEEKIKAALQKNPHANFQTIHDQITKPFENIIHYATISPRVFEAAITRTAMVLFRGKYSDILHENEHYIPLNKDFSNFEEVVNKIKNNDYLEKMVDNTYQHLIASGNYSAKKLAEIVDHEIKKTITNANATSTANNITNNFSRLKKKHKLLNYYRILTAEIFFMLKNFILLWNDQRFKGLRKYLILYQGAHRYYVYIFARFLKK